MIQAGSDRQPVLVVYGTRPEAIKMAPVIELLAQSTRLRPVVLVTGQHRGMVDQVNALFGISPDVDLDIFEHGQSLASITSRVLLGVTAAIQRLRPAAVLVQGDTTSAFAAALAAFYEGVPIAHVEAGLRTGSLGDPFPEEGNRALIGRLASLHLAPTASARANLAAENVSAASIVTTGNTVVDALLRVVDMRPAFAEPALRRIVEDPRRVIVVTAHRRESWGEGMRAISRALQEIAQRPDVLIVLPAHPNPSVRQDLARHLDIGAENVRWVEPLSYSDFAQLLARADLILSDSGGVQEEAPSVGTPVLVMRSTTERWEAIEAGTARLVGTDTATIVDTVAQLLDDRSVYQAAAMAGNPFGDGHAAARTVAALEQLLGVGRRLPDFAGRSAEVLHVEPSVA